MPGLGNSPEHAVQGALIQLPCSHGPHVLEVEGENKQIVRRSSGTGAMQRNSRVRGRGQGDFTEDGWGWGGVPRHLSGDGRPVGNESFPLLPLFPPFLLVFLPPSFPPSCLSFLSRLLSSLFFSKFVFKLQ